MTMQEVNCVCFLLCIPLLFSIVSESCLDGNLEPLISGRGDQFFEANSVDVKHTPEQARQNGLSWCSSNSLSASSDPPWLQVTFETNVNIFKILIGGYDGYFRNYYITSFQVHIGDGTTGSLHPLTISDGSTQHLVFMRPRTYHVRVTVLPSPVTTKVLRIVAVGWTPQNQVCLRLEALGCPVSPVATISTVPNTEASFTTPETLPTEKSEASSNSSPETPPTEAEASTFTTQETTLTEEVSEASLYTTLENPSTEEISEASSNATLEMKQSSPDQTRGAIVGGAVGGAFGLIVVLLLLAIVVVAIFIFTQKRRAQVQLSESNEDLSAHNFDNSIYGEEIASPSIYNAIPERTIDNSLYGDSGEFSTEYHHLTRPGIPTSHLSNTYESVPYTTTTTPTTVFHEPMQHLKGTMDPLSQQNDPIYGNLNS